MASEILDSLLTIDCEVQRRTRHARPDDRAALALRRAMRVLARGVLSAPAADVPFDADAMVRAYLAAGGDWPKLVAAVNRHGLDAQDRRVQ